MSKNLEDEDIDALFEQVVTQREIAVPSKSVPEEPEILSVPAENHALYDRLGSVVRQLHDALQQLGYGQILDDTLRDISDSQSRLEYIASLTEQSANKVLNAVDEGLPVQDEQITKANNLERRWNDMLGSEFATVELKLLAIDSCSFASEVARNAEAEKARLMEIMMAQDFQDITGQIIKKVVTLTQKLEKELTQLLQDYAVTPLPNKSVDLLAGPAVPDLAMDQDDVDSMLADLGF
ncbi:protein phosphatase CheZ [Methylobacter sp. S3L5C]|uniref:protein phosphatase CheZ n=1 Tax=Methylobacter sp. S3L5C TaxID=2839024 RepID=UPI001FACC41D|nr:protein phosphatase CheZ [Methylobacter sp. S3L5C]UOA10486.1 protein phosphatase CheZ [Methylobacter sp. S3L5C]